MSKEMEQHYSTGHLIRTILFDSLTCDAAALPLWWCVCSLPPPEGGVARLPIARLTLDVIYMQRTLAF